MSLFFLLWLGIFGDLVSGDRFGYMDIASNVGLWILPKDAINKFRVVRHICVFCLYCVVDCGLSITRSYSSCYYVFL